MNYYGYDIRCESDLAHHGILGMKWGVRRYQNKDGTRTAAGKKRYSGSKTLGLYDTRPENHKTAFLDASDAKKKKGVEASAKEASETIRYYGGKNSAIREAKKEYDYTLDKNYTKLGVGEGLSIGGAAIGYAMLKAAETSLASIAGASMLGVGGVAIPVLAIGAHYANKALVKNRNEKIDYILDSPTLASTLQTHVNVDRAKVYNR